MCVAMHSLMMSQRMSFCSHYLLMTLMFVYSNSRVQLIKLFFIIDY